MMPDWTRRHELGKMWLDVAKYILTIVVVGGLFAGRMDVRAIVLGFVLGAAVAGVGFQVIPSEEDADE